MLTDLLYCMPVHSLVRDNYELGHTYYILRQLEVIVF